MLLKRCAMLLLALLPLAATAQVEESLEQWVEESGDSEAAADLGDLLLQLRDHPVNINDTHAVAALPFVSPFQLQALRNYIVLHGQLLSLKELAFVPGFDSTTMLLVGPLLTVRPYEPSRRWRPSEGHHRLVTGLGGTVEQAAGHANGHYEGDNLHALLCYTYTLQHHLSLRLVADKDPAEAWGKDNYYGYHLMLDDLGRLERLIVGRYNVQFGQGLTLWTGLRPFNLTGSSPLRYGPGVRPAATFYEEDYQEGVAARVRLARGVRLSAFASRTDGESLAGAHADYRRGNLVVGLTAAYTALDDSLALRDYAYNQNRFRGREQLNAGLDALWQWRRLTLFGEVAVGENLAYAALGGAQLQADSRNRIGATIRHYHPLYHNLHANGHTLGSTQGETGLTLDAENRLPLDLTLLTSLDLHRFPSLRYADYAPSAGAWLRMQLSRSWGSHFVGSLRYAYRQKERNIPNLDSTLYLGEQTLRQQWQGELRGTWGRWVLASRGIIALFESESGGMERGWLAHLSARYSHPRLQATAALAWFDIDSYAARIYLGESSLQYAWSMPSLYGRGLRGSLLARFHLNRHLMVAARYALTLLPGQEAIGSGDSRTEGPLRQSWMVQLRWAL